MSYKKRMPSERVMVFNEMPELDHFPGKGSGIEYEPKNSEVLNWVRDQYGILEWAMEFARRKGLITYDIETKKWKGSRINPKDVFY